MSIKSVGQQLKQRRESRGFSQRDLSRLAGISQGRISKLECGKAEPNEREWSLLREHLGLDETPPNRPPLPFPSTGFRVPRPQPDGPAEVSFESRFYRARKVFGSLADELLTEIQAREDASLAMKFLNEALLDSAYEAMFWMQLLAGGAKPCWYGLLKAGFRRHRVVDRRRNTVGDARQPCLEVSGAALLFPQVSLDTRRAYYRLDALVCVISQGRRRWVNLEIDGSGHAGDLDEQRQADLGLPTIRLGKAQLSQPRLLDRLLPRLLAELAPPDSTAR